MSRNEHDLLMIRYLDGAAGPGELERLGRVLQEDAEARALLRSIALQAMTLADLARSRELEARPAPPVPQAARGRSRRALFALAAATLLALGAGLAWWAGSPPATVTLSRLQGSATWRPEGGLPRTGLEPKATLAGPGTLTIEGAGTFAEVRFEDGTTLGLSGDSEFSILAGVQKRLVLSRGSVVVDARPQPPGRPILVRTPTAEVSVVGTLFSLSCEPPRTRIAVEEGKVRLRRLADGASTEVARGETATATLESATPLESRTARPLPLAFRETFEHPPTGAWKGEWQGADAKGPSRLRNALDVSYRRKDGTVVPAYVVSLGNSSQPLCQVRPETVLRVRYRLERPYGLILLVSIQDPEGRFAGNFQVDLGADASAAEPDGWKTFRAPLASLPGRFPEGVRFPPSGRLALLFAACYSPEAHLEVAEVAIE